MFRHRGSLLYLALNVAVAIAYVRVASISWTEPEVRDIPGASGGAPLVWALTAVPIVLFALLANLGVLFWAWRARRLGAFGQLACGALILWVGAVMIDFAHH
jgi:hypothetical protein